MENGTPFRSMENGTLFRSMENGTPFRSMENGTPFRLRCKRKLCILIKNLPAPEGFFILALFK
jgi:hypothetical protein